MRTGTLYVPFLFLFLFLFLFCFLSGPVFACVLPPPHGEVRAHASYRAGAGVWLNGDTVICLVFFLKMLRGSKPFTTVLEYISSKKKDPKSRSGDPKGQTSARPTKEKCALLRTQRPLHLAV